MIVVSLIWIPSYTCQCLIYMNFIIYVCVEQKEMIVFGQHIVSTVAILEESVVKGKLRGFWTPGEFCPSLPIQTGGRYL